MNTDAIDRVQVQTVAERLLAAIKANPVVSGLAFTAILGTAWYGTRIKNEQE